MHVKTKNQYLWNKLDKINFVHYLRINKKRAYQQKTVKEIRFVQGENVKK